MRVRRSTSIGSRTAYACVVAFALFGGAARAQSLSVSGSPVQALAVNSVVSAGLTPQPDSDATTTFSVRTTNGAGPQKITARLSSAMPAGVTLTVKLATVTGSVAVGTVTLTTTAQTVLTNITTTTTRTGTITYALNATLAAGVVASTSRSVVFTIVTYP